MPDIFRGSQVTLIGRYRNPIDLDFVRLQLGGMSSGSSKNFQYNNLRFPLREESNDFLPRLWATRRVGWLMEQVRTNGEQAELRDEIVDLGTRYGIVTPYTSYLALEPGAVAQTVTVTGNNQGFINGGTPINGRGSGNLRPSSAPMKAADASAITGVAGVQQSKRAREQQEMVTVEKDSPSSAIRTAGGKTFYLRDGVWTDSEFKAGSTLPVTTVKFSSEEYFNLLKQKPRLGEFFSLGEKVIVIFEGRVYKVEG
jgi:Ca-activated chloride channel family protein